MLVRHTRGQSRVVIQDSSTGGRRTVERAAVEQQDSEVAPRQRPSPNLQRPVLGDTQALMVRRVAPHPLDARRRRMSGMLWVTIELIEGD